MSVWILISIFCVLTVIALGLALYPLRQSRSLMLGVACAFVAILLLLYHYFGGFTSWQNYQGMFARKQQVEMLLQSVSGVDEVIIKLQSKLKQHPNSAKGWYLLGRLYAHQGQWRKAQVAFSTAHALKPNDDMFALNLANSLLQANHQQFNDEIRRLLTTVLQHNPDNPDAMAMLAMDAYQSHHYAKAVTYWRQLLLLTPDDSEEAKLLQKAIQKAQQHLK